MYFVDYWATAQFSVTYLLTEHIFPAESSILKKRLNNIEKFTNDNQMRINESKSKILIFNKYDFPPEFSFIIITVYLS